MARVLVALALCVLLLHDNIAWEAQAASYTVGNSAGWDLSADLQSWSDAKIFNVGDVLVFQYSKTHTLDEVDAAGFNNCSAANAIMTKSDGNTTVALTAGGDRYFICGNQMHCLGGLKLHVHVASPASSGSTPGASAGAGTPLASPGAALGPVGGGEYGDAGIPRLDLSGSRRLGVKGAVLAALWLCVAAALFV